MAVAPETKISTCRETVLIYLLFFFFRCAVSFFNSRLARDKIGSCYDDTCHRLGNYFHFWRRYCAPPRAGIYVWCLGVCVGSVCICIYIYVYVYIYMLHYITRVCVRTLVATTLDFVLATIFILGGGTAPLLELVYMFPSAWGCVYIYTHIYVCICVYILHCMCVCAHACNNNTCHRLGNYFHFWRRYCAPSRAGIYGSKLIARNPPPPGGFFC